MFTQLRPAIVVFVALSIITGIVYPLTITGIAQTLFSHQANGSLIVDGDTIVGSELIGQTFDDPKYFWSRPSAIGYNAAASSGSNLGPTNPALLDAVKGRVETLQKADSENKAPVPVDLVTTSSSGLDPHISPAAAEYQVNRVAKARNLDSDAVRQLVAQHQEGRTFGILGEPRINVLLLNRALDKTNSVKR
jgi:potassium-transporting ATPase KdpC subunit